MSAVTANQLIKRQEGCKQSYPAAAIHHYQGALAYIDASGYLTDTDNAGANKFAGVVIGEVDNSAGNAGDLNVEVWQEGVFAHFVVSGASQGTVGSDIYGIDNITVQTSSANASYVGRCVGYVSSTVILVKITVETDPANVTSLALDDDEEAQFGTSQDALILWSTADASNHSLVVALGDSNQGLHVTDNGAKATDWNIAGTTDPNVYIHSNTTPATDYLRLGGHTGTVADIDVVGGTTLNIKIAGATAALFTAANLSLGDAADTAANSLTVFDGGAEKPGMLVLYSGEATGVPYYLWVDSSGDLRIHTAAPTDEDMDGTVVGSQS
jgi:hypothetical protein